LPRAAKVRVRALDAQGQPYEMTGEGLLARAFQHEIDHLDGKLFIDRISRIKRELYRRKITKMIKEGKADGKKPSNALI
jgi:peptide deformylase